MRRPAEWDGIQTKKKDDVWERKKIRSCLWWAGKTLKPMRLVRIHRGGRTGESRNRSDSNSRQKMPTKTGIQQRRLLANEIVRGKWSRKSPQNHTNLDNNGFIARTSRKTRLEGLGCCLNHAELRWKKRRKKKGKRKVKPSLVKLREPAQKWQDVSVRADHVSCNLDAGEKTKTKEPSTRGELRRSNRPGQKATGNGRK